MARRYRGDRRRLSRLCGDDGALGGDLGPELRQRRRARRPQRAPALARPADSHTDGALAHDHARWPRDGVVDQPPGARRRDGHRLWREVRPRRDADRAAGRPAAALPGSRQLRPDQFPSRYHSRPSRGRPGPQPAAAASRHRRQHNCRAAQPDAGHRPGGALAAAPPAHRARRFPLPRPDPTRPPARRGGRPESVALHDSPRVHGPGGRRPAGLGTAGALPPGIRRGHGARQ